MESHIQCDHLQGSEEEITPEFISLWGKGDGLLYSPHRPWLQNTLCFEERAIKLSATSGSSLDLLLFSRVSLRWMGCHFLLQGIFLTPGVGDGQRSLVCCSPWGSQESDMTEQLNWTDKLILNKIFIAVYISDSRNILSNFNLVYGFWYSHKLSISWNTTWHFKVNMFKTKLSFSFKVVNYLNFSHF